LDLLEIGSYPSTPSLDLLVAESGIRAIDVFHDHVGLSSLPASIIAIPDFG
jgi:hypothetical protein